MPVVDTQFQNLDNVTKVCKENSYEPQWRFKSSLLSPATSARCYGAQRRLFLRPCLTAPAVHPVTNNSMQLTLCRTPMRRSRKGRHSPFWRLAYSHAELSNNLISMSPSCVCEQDVETDLRLLNSKKVMWLCVFQKSECHSRNAVCRLTWTL